MKDFPEAQFLRFPKVLRRWTWRALRDRLRAPGRRKRWDRENRARTASYRRTAAEAKRPEITPQSRACAVGDFMGFTGLSRAGLYELNELCRMHPGLEVHDLGPAIHQGADISRADGPPIDFLYLLAAPDTYAYLYSTLPPARIAGAWRTGLWVWETPIFPSHWRFAIDLVDEIWTPSEYSAGAIRRAVGPIPVSVRPHAVTADQSSRHITAKAQIAQKHGLPKNAFIGVAIMDLSSCPARKNPWAHVAAWQRAFGDAEDKVLLMKIRTARKTRILRTELGEMIGTAKNIRLIEQEMSAGEITELQQAADVYLSLHRAEGYGLNVHECLALGTPVVATHFSANAEYGPGFASYHGIAYSPVQYRDWTGHYADAAFSWAEVDLDEAAAKLRELSEAAAAGGLRNDHAGASGAA